MMLQVTCPNCGHALARASLTPAACKLLDFIKVSIAARGFPPSYSEMLAATNQKSKSGVARLVRQLEERGYVTKAPKRRYSLALVGASP